MGGTGGGLSRAETMRIKHHPGTPKPIGSISLSVLGSGPQQYQRLPSWARFVGRETSRALLESRNRPNSRPAMGQAAS